MDDQLQMTRRKLLRMGAAGTGLGAAALALPNLARADRPESVQVAGLQRSPAGRLPSGEDDAGPRSDDVALGRRCHLHQQQHRDDLRRLRQHQVLLAGFGLVHPSSFLAVPSYKTKIDVHGDEAFLYFECHDIGNFATGEFNDSSVTTIVNDTFLAGALRHEAGSWLFWKMTAGEVPPALVRPLLLPVTNSGIPAPTQALRRRRLRRLQWGRTAARVSAAKRGRCSECVRGRLPLPEALRDELGPLLLAPAVQHLEV